MHKMKKHELLLFILLIVLISFFWFINTKNQFNEINQKEKFLELFNKGKSEVNDMFTETKEKIKNIEQIKINTEKIKQSNEQQQKQ